MKLEYKCFPIWVYEDNGTLIDNDLPKVLLGDKRLDSLCVTVQEEFDNHYTNDGVEFKYNKFDNISEKKQFAERIKVIEKLIRKKCENNYKIINDVNINKL